MRKIFVIILFVFVSGVAYGDYMSAEYSNEELRAWEVYSESLGKRSVGLTNRDKIVFLDGYRIAMAINKKVNEERERIIAPLMAKISEEVKRIKGN